ncbi:MAG TPA: bifunctional UDP-N-acetylglucosamine diphosphorylase/glucosamine-1-phosphate N-acetyltransferase GlmU [Acidobacteriota bacterium]|nr:bifunctional UDP-N-acetylglucosamine diphosphorylase/glucosamine-1-phosphate N-acetyltransferase GlmU [Acidobacteriota bacterium]
MLPVHVVILAAGEGTRMRSDTPKLLHRVAGRPIIEHVVNAARALCPTSITLVVPPEHTGIRDTLDDDALRFAVQDPALGTGDAAACGLTATFPDGDHAGVVVVINGDCPGISSTTLRALVDAHDTAAGTFLTVSLDDPTGYGRVIQAPDGALERIVEETDATDEERALREVNAGIYLFTATALRDALDALKPDNSQGEFYLTDTLQVLSNRGDSVTLFHHSDADEVHGVNTRGELARAEAFLRRRKLDELMEAGVTLRNPAAVSVDVDVHVGNDTVLYPGVTLEAASAVGQRCTLYPNVRVTASQIGDDVVVYDGCVLEHAVVESGARVGPYARLRPGAHICERAKVGNFVEVKKTKLGPGSKAGHLAYLGDAEIGADVNVGAGTITCNYDGVNKHQTLIGEGAFIGSNTALIAPVRIGRGAYIGAGSTITKDVPDHSLGIARGRQVVREGWAKRANADRDERD